MIRELADRAEKDLIQKINSIRETKHKGEK